MEYLLLGKIQCHAFQDCFMIREHTQFHWDWNGGLHWTWRHISGFCSWHSGCGLIVGGLQCTWCRKSYSGAKKNNVWIELQHKQVKRVMIIFTMQGRGMHIHRTVAGHCWPGTAQHWRKKSESISRPDTVYTPFNKCYISEIKMVNSPFH